MSSLRPRLARFVLILVAPLVLAACGYNVIPTQQVKAQQAWAEVQNQYQRRSDLIPNLVNTVKGYAAQEKSVLVEVTEARASATQVKVDASTLTDPAKFQQYQAAQDRLTGVLGRLMMIQERYPDLKSNENFMALQSQLEGTENRIAIARRDYIEAVRVYNTEIVTFPGRIWRSVMYPASQPMATFDITPQETQTPRVDFGTKK